MRNLMWERIKNILIWYNWWFNGAPMSVFRLIVDVGTDFYIDDSGLLDRQYNDLNTKEISHVIRDMVNAGVLIQEEYNIWLKEVWGA